MPLHSADLQSLIHAAEKAPNVDIYGFYGYAARTANEWEAGQAEDVLQTHISAVLQAARLVSDPTKPLVLAIGSSITARVLRPLKERLAANLTLEIVAGRHALEDPNG